MSRTALIMAGGTGGHVIPALAVAELLRSRGWSIEWLGTKRGIESRLVPAKNIKLHTIGVEGVRGRGKLSLLKAPFMIIKALLQALQVIRSVRPDVVVGLGGFASGPGGLVTRLMGLPLVVHEQNAIPGTTNRLLSYLTRHRLTGFPGVLSGQYVGNPVPKNISTLPFAVEHVVSPSRVLIVGGSLGALALNQRMAAVFSLIPAESRPAIVHQCGRGKRDETEAAYRNAGVDAEVIEFIDDMAEAYRSASVIVCRSGALTVSEVACIAKPAIFVPFPYAIDDHQTANAQFLVKLNVASIVQQDDWNDEIIKNILVSYLTPNKLLTESLSGQYENAIRNADEKVADYVELLCQ